MNYNNQQQPMENGLSTGRDADNGIGVLINTLVRNNPKLAQHIRFIDQALQQNTQNMSASDKTKAEKIYNDYMWKTRGKTYSVTNFPIEIDQKMHINKINSQELNAFKKYIEVAACQVIFAWIRDEYTRTGNIDESVQILLASDYDDIIGGTDYIVKTEKKGNDGKTKEKEIFCIDLAVTKRIDYVYEKIDKNKKMPREFLAHNETPKFQIEKFIVAIPPDIMGAFITELVYFIEHGKYGDAYQPKGERTPSEFDLFKKIYTLTESSSLIKTRSGSVRNNIRERVGIVTNLPILKSNHDKQMRF